MDKKSSIENRAMHFNMESTKTHIPALSPSITPTSVLRITRYLRHLDVPLPVHGGGGRTLHCQLHGTTVRFHVYIHWERKGWTSNELKCLPCVVLRFVHSLSLSFFHVLLSLFLFLFSLLFIFLLIFLVLVLLLM